MALALSADGRMAVASSDTALYVFDEQGQVHWSEEDTWVYALAISPNGMWVAFEATDTIRLFDREGTFLGKWEFSSLSCGLVLTENGAVLAATDNEISCFSQFSESPCWTYAWGNLCSLCATPNGRLILAGTEDGEILLLNEDGRLLDRLFPGGRITTLSVDAQGTAFVAFDTEGDRLLCYTAEGLLSWEKALPEQGVIAVNLNSEGNVIALMLHNEIAFWDRRGEEVARYDVIEKVEAAAFNTEGTVVLARDENGCLVAYALHPPLPLGIEQLLWRSILPIRREYLADPVGGFCAWLEAFDQALAQEKFELCEGLWEEIGQGYSLDAFAQAYVESRRGVLWLARGIALHQRGETESAIDYYRRGLQIHSATKNSEGEGQARLLLARFDDDAQPQIFPPIGQLKVLGSAEAFLTHEVEGGALPRQLAAILCAGKRGYLEPLLKALEKSDMVANNAVAALASLDPGPSQATLLEVLDHPNWFVCWRVLSVLRQRNEGQLLREFSPEAAAALLPETDPAVLRNIVRVVEETDDPEWANALIPLSLDSDPDIRHALCRVLSRSGDRRALQPLELIPQGFAFFDGGWVRDAADEAAEEICERYPAPVVERVILRAPESTPIQRFPATTTNIDGLITFTEEQGELCTHIRYDHFRPYRIILDLVSTNPGQGSENALVQLLPEHVSENNGGRVLHFSFTPPPTGWQRRLYHLEVFFDGEPEASCLFEIIENITIELVSTVAVEGFPQDRAKEEKNALPAGWHDLSCLIPRNGSLGLFVIGQILNEDEEVLAETVARVPNDGQQARLQWPCLNLQPGLHTAIAWSETGMMGTYQFQVVALREAWGGTDDVDGESDSDPRLPNEPTATIPPPNVFILALVTALQWGLLGLLLTTIDWIISKIAGVAVHFASMPLQLAHRLAALPFFFWIMAGGLYGLWKARSDQRWRWGVSLALTWFVISLLIQQLTYTIFGIGYLWPQTLGGVFHQVLFMCPYYAWGNTVLLAFVGLVFVLSKDAPRAYPAFGAGLLISIPVLYSQSLVGGVVGGILAWGTLVLFSEAGAQAAWVWGVKTGFLLASLAAWWQVVVSAFQKNHT